MKKIILFYIFTISFWSINFKLNSQTQQATLLYKVSGNGLKQNSYLWGTYHLLSKRFLDLEKKKVNQALKKCKGVVVEMVMDSKSGLKLAPYLFAKDSALDVIFSKTEYDSIAQLLKTEADLNLASFNKMKPFVVHATLLKNSKAKSISDAAKYGNSAMDVDFVSYAKTNSLTVNALETIEEQAKLLYSGSILTQKKMLLAMLRDFETVKKMQDSLYFSYKREDVKTIENLFNDPSIGNYEMDMEALLKNRNLNWMQKLPNLFAERSQFVAVGAGHLFGKDGLITLLSAAGYKVEPVLVKK